MAIRSKDELLEKVKAVIGEDAGDGSIELLEDITDTLDDYGERLADSKASEWEAKYNDAVAEKEATESEWRKRYRDRFFGTEENGETETKLEDGSVEDEVEVKTTFEELFE